MEYFFLFFNVHVHPVLDITNILFLLLKDKQKVYQF
jgi:hypothetical protein